MRYEEFLDAWRDAFEKSGGFARFGFRPTETLDLHSMSRQYNVLLARHEPQVDPFTVTATCSWTWDALKVARTDTIEEDVLHQLLGGRDFDDIETERPWLRINCNLAAKVHLDAKLQLPDAASWRKWSVEVGSLLEPLLPSVRLDETNPEAVTGARGEPSVELRCGEGGQLFLTGVLVEAWSAVELPRIWDDPEREPDADPRETLEALATNVKAALRVWSEALQTLQRAAEVH